VAEEFSSAALITGASNPGRAIGLWSRSVSFRGHAGERAKEVGLLFDDITATDAKPEAAYLVRTIASVI